MFKASSTTLIKRKSFSHKLISQYTLDTPREP